MTNFFLKTLYQKRFFTFWWFVGITGVTLLTSAFYDSFKATDVEELLKALPPAVQSIAGDAASFKSVDGYLQQQIYALRVPLLSIILSISLLVGLTAGDEQKGLLETQLSLPVSRTRLLIQKVGAGLLVLLTATFGAVAGVALGMALLDESFGVANVALYTMNAAAVAAVYGLVGVAVASLSGSRGLALGFSSGFAFLSYLIHTMAPSVSALASIDKLTFFYYYQNNPFSLMNFFVLLMAAAGLVAVSIIGFNRRDIRSH